MVLCYSGTSGKQRHFCVTVIIIQIHVEVCIDDSVYFHFGGQF